MLCKSPENRPSASQLLSFIHQHFPSITNPHIQLSFQSSLISFEYQFSNQIHEYILEINPLGFESFGATYKATLMLDNKDFCMKITKDVFLDSERQKYIQESKLLVNVYHPNIIRYYQSFWNLQKIYIVMELADGGNLV
jgi:serine/threonine protein kinase